MEIDFTVLKQLTSRFRMLLGKGVPIDTSMLVVHRKEYLDALGECTVVSRYRLLDVYTLARIAYGN